jgi:hypothetical protein
MGSYSLNPVQLVSIDTMLRQRLRATKHRGATTVHSSVIGPTLHLLCTAHSTTQQSLAAPDLIRLLHDHERTYMYTTKVHDGGM